MEKTCFVDKECLSLFPRFSLPVRCKFIVLIFKINFLWFDLPNPRIDFLVLFENKALLGKTNHIRFLVLPIPFMCKIWKKSIFQLLPLNTRCLLKVALKFWMQRCDPAAKQLKANQRQELFRTHWQTNFKLSGKLNSETWFRLIIVFNNRPCRTTISEMRFAQRTQSASSHALVRIR